MEYQINKMTDDDWPAVRSIYREGLSTEQASFESDIPEWKDWDANHLPHSRLVTRSQGAVIAWTAISRVSNRRVYSGVAEVSIYVGITSQGQGVGSALLSALITASEENGIWTLQAGIFPENTASLNLHKKCNFKQVGRRERIGKMGYGKLMGVWRDVILMEHRSDHVV